jgi:trans-aconitate methyltransferase
MTIIARQFSRPRGPLGSLIGFGMARMNGEFSRWVVQQVQDSHNGEAGRIAELGPGPGLGIEAMLRQFPQARVWGIDPSPVMLSQARKRNRAAVEAGRLTLTNGTAAALSEVAPAHIVMANHVLYFWHEPAAEMAQIHDCLRPGGLLALGYQLRRNMPPMARKRFPQDGHLLYDSADEVGELARAAGFATVSHLVKGPAEAPHGRLVLAVA